MVGLDAQSSLQRAKKYAAIKYALSIAETLLLLVIFFISLRSGLSHSLRDFSCGITSNFYTGLIVYFLLGYACVYAATFPLTIIHSFILERAFALSTQKLSSWLFDQLKGLILSVLLGLACLPVYYYIVRHFPDWWWLIVSICWIFFSLILARLMPVLIIPLFFKYKKLTDESLRKRIVALAERMKVKILDVFEIDFSKKTLKANAAFVGWGATRRVLLADTLKDKYNQDEISVIIAHEFAHYQLKHLLKLICISASVTVVSFYLVFITHHFSLRAFGLVTLVDFASLPLLLIYFTFLSIIVGPLENYLSRIFETNADIRAIKVTGLQQAFISTMEKLGSQNLADTNPHPLVKFFFFDHPPISERIALARALLIESSQGNNT